MYVLFNLIVFAQSNIKLHLNTRNARDTTLFDYYSKLEIQTFIIDSIIKIHGLINYERDNGIKYYSYGYGIDSKFGGVDSYYDTEKQIKYFMMYITYPVLKWLTVGYNYIDNQNHTVIIEGDLKWTNFALSINDKFCMFKISFIPEYEVSETFKIGIGSNLLFFNKKTKWDAGLTLNFNIL